jgi:hypothetical protein
MRRSGQSAQGMRMKLHHGPEGDAVSIDLRHDLPSAACRCCASVSCAWATPAAASIFLLITCSLPGRHCRKVYRAGLAVQCRTVRGFA